MTPPWMPNDNMIRTPAASDGGGGSAGKTPSSKSIGTSITVAKIEKTTLKQRCNNAYETRRSTGHRLPSQTSAGERGANIHAGHPADEHIFPRHGDASIESRHGLLDELNQSGNRPPEPDSRK